MRLAEELVLLLLNEESGYLEQVHGWNLSCVLAGAVLADLAFERRIDTDLESLSLTDPTPTGDALLDPVLAEIAADATTHNAQYWIEKTSVRSDDVLDEVLERLVANKILRHELGGFWSLTRHVAHTGSYPVADGSARAEVKGRIHRTIVADLVPHPRDIIIIGLMNACDAFRFLLDLEEYEAAKKRIDLLGNMDLLGQALAAAVAESSSRLETMAVAHSKPIPKVNLLMLLGQRSLWCGNVARLMADLYEKYGPVFSFKAPFAKRGMPVLAGSAANTWMNRKGRDYLRTKECLADWERVYGAARTLPGMDGADHYRLRKAQHPSHTRAAIVDRLDELYEQARASLQQWQVGNVLAGVTTCRAIMGSQISRLAVGVDTSDHILDLVAYKERSLVTHVQHSLPKFMLYTPGMRRKRKKVFDLLARIKAAHTPAQRKGKPRDFIDDMISLHVSDPQFLPETDSDFVFVGPLIASIYLGSALAFALYAMISHPRLYERVQAEADALFAGGYPDKDEFTMTAIDVTHRLIMESHRLYPIIPVTVRHVMNPVVFEGYPIPVGSRVIIAQTASHYLEENFPDPLKFDIDRYLQGRDEHRKRGVYAPFGLGTHTCLGSRWVEFQMVVNVLLIAHHFQLALDPTDYRLRFNPFPTSSPDKKLQFRVAAQRHEFAGAGEEASAPSAK